jgi:hypothetical protein
VSDVGDIYCTLVASVWRDLFEGWMDFTKIK